MNTEIKNAIAATGQDAQYDESAKRLFGQKNILAHILIKTVDEFKGMSPDEIIPYIIGTPYISRVPTEPGLTNVANQSKYRKKQKPAGWLVLIRKTAKSMRDWCGLTLSFVSR